MIKVRVFRPFPGAELSAALENAKGIAIMDRAESFSGCGGPLGSELKAALYDAKNESTTVNYFYGLAGRDYTVETACGIYQDLIDYVSGKQEAEQFKYIGLRK